ncbi:OmpP1/FadL family transporter [Ferrimonas balearica]|uniref:OmpP1/FadL family transporter n=1 Tax=Ferrimonas balearica TaxID=44012 RepID=UPI001C94C6CB|nr:outer membrane protein transport protein [Ferrimonas balearica]MBY6224722.1 OmpP1/FadL family transporter [Ferrimonas balearica]
MKTMNKTLLATAIALASTQSLAAGFQLNSQSATGIGRAFAGDAVIADNASVLARNPAAMALFDAPAFSGGLTYADVQVDVMDATWYSQSLSGQPTMTDLGSIDDAAEGKIIPNIFYIHPLNDTFAVGVGAFTNYGTGTDTSSLTQGKQLGVFGPADLIGNTEVTTVNFNVSMSARINKHLSLGAGLDVVYGEGVLTRQGTVLGQNMQPVDVEADGIGFGGIVGATYEINENHRFGLSYRFSPDMDVEGTLKKIAIEGVIPSMVDYDELTVPLADIAQFAGFHQLTNQFAMHYTAQWTQWSNFDSVDLHKDGVTEVLKDYQWKDSWFLSLGGTYTVNDKWTLRAGYAYDQGVIDEIQSISIPDSDRQWLSAGFSYHLTPKSTIDFGFAHVMGEKVEVKENSMFGQLVAHTESGANYYSIQYSHQF